MLEHGRLGAACSSTPSKGRCRRRASSRKKALALGPAADPRRQQDRPRRAAIRTAPSTTSFDLFCALGATDAQLDFPVIYASGREGCAIKRPRATTHEGSRAAARPDRREGAAARGRRRRAARACTWRRSTTTTTSATSRSAASIRGAIKLGDRVLCAHRDGKREEFRVAEGARLPGRSSASSWPRRRPATSSPSPAWRT